MIEETQKFISLRRHEEILEAAKSMAYKKGLGQGKFQAGNINWNEGYTKGLDEGYKTAQKEIISKIKDVLDYEKGEGD